MRYPQLLVHEGDGRLAGLVRDSARTWGWALREPRRWESCLHLLRQGGPSVLVLKVGRDLVRELTLLERVHYLFPDTAIVVVGDTDDAAVAGLAWDLGANLVLALPLFARQLPDIVAGLMEGVMARPAEGDSPPSKPSAEPMSPNGERP